jgi:hypothetical protein
MKFPFREVGIGNKFYVREFSENVDSNMLVWHQDEEDRKIEIVESNGWKIQLDNELPILLEEGKTYIIPAYEFHRVLKGEGKLLILMEKV